MRSKFLMVQAQYVVNVFSDISVFISAYLALRENSFNMYYSVLHIWKWYIDYKPSKFSWKFSINSQKILAQV